MSVTLAEAQTDLAKLLRALPPGAQLIVTDNGHPVASITALAPPAPPAKRVPGLWKGKLTITADDDEHLADFAGYMA